MRVLLLVVTILWFNSTVCSQDFSAMDFLSASSSSFKKFESFLNRKNFLPGGSRIQNDTIVNTYNFKAKKKKEDTLHITRVLECFQLKNDVSFIYFTSVRDEFIENLNELKADGFFCGNLKDTASLFFQKRNVSVFANTIKEPSGDTVYSLSFQKKQLPLPQDIQFAEDLLQFYSHEYIVSVFGSTNVIKDVYYFSETDVSKCSVLFPKTNRQAIFIWEDEVNLCKPSCVIVGGNTNNMISANYDGVILENVWSLKEGVQSGMSIRSLLKLNGTGFTFYGKNSSLPYMIMPENSGNVNFQNNRIILGCLNPSATSLLNNPTVNAEDILKDDPGLFVFLIMLLPQKK